MRDIKIEIEELLKRQGVAPPLMTDEEFMEKFDERFKSELPRVIERLANHIVRIIGREEMERIGRGVPCRYARDPKERHCTKPPDCYECPNYRPISRWRQWFLARTRKQWEYVIISWATISLILALIFPVSGFVLGTWFVIVVFSRLHNFGLYKIIEAYEGRHQEKNKKKKKNNNGS
jgi:hypothetical protein